MKLLTLTYSDSSDEVIMASGIRTILRRSSSVGTITTFLFSFEPGAEAKRISSDLILKYFKFFDYPRGVCETKSKGGNFKIVENTEVMYYLEALVFQSLLIYSPCEVIISWHAFSSSDYSVLVAKRLSSGLESTNLKQLLIESFPVLFSSNFSPAFCVWLRNDKRQTGASID